MVNSRERKRERKSERIESDDKLLESESFTRRIKFLTDVFFRSVTWGLCFVFVIV